VVLLRRVGAVLLILAISLIGATKIGDVDFKNLDYPWGAPQLEVPTSWKWLAGKPKSSVRVREGRHAFSASDESLPDGYLMISSVTYGDLNGDGRDEAVVDLLCSTGGTANWHYLYVFTLMNGSPRLLGRLRSGSRADGGLLKVGIEKNTLVLDFADTDRRIADCCSEGYIRVRYRWQAGRFIEVGSRISGDLKIGR
jgi:hypothetical protein